MLTLSVEFLLAKFSPWYSGLAFYRKGNFTVWSVYCLEMASTNKEMQSGSSCGGQELSWFWKMLCRLKIPSKIKVFAGKCFLNILPVKANLIQKKMSVSGICDTCGGGETVRRCFQECEFGDYGWAAVGLYPVWQDGALYSFFDWVWRIVKHEESGVLGLLFSVCWGIWLNCNQLIIRGSGW